MPKGGRGASSKKPTTSSSLPNEEESNVVFGDAKSAKKSKKLTTWGDPAGDGGGNRQRGPSDGPKNPDTRTLIAGASWTGKLPVNMLSEHCQKQKWAKPEYTMV
jgi:ATP-dependent RNA helicase DHX57